MSFYYDLPPAKSQSMGWVILIIITIVLSLDLIYILRNIFPELKRIVQIFCKKVKNQPRGDLEDSPAKLNAKKIKVNLNKITPFDNEEGAKLESSRTTTPLKSPKKLELENLSLTALDSPKKVDLGEKYKE